MLERERERGEGERGRSGPLLPVGEVIQTASNIEAEAQNQTKSLKIAEERLAAPKPETDYLFLQLLAVMKGNADVIQHLIY